MRNMAMIASSLLLVTSAAAAASADYYLKIDSVGLDQGGPLYLKAHSSGDLDGDGQADDVVIRMECTAGVMHSAEYQVTGPRDAASGQASGKRMHKPLTIVKEWGAASPTLKAMKAGYDVKKVEGTGARAKPMGADDWNPMTLANSEGICAAGQATKATKTRSNIQNN